MNKHEKTAEIKHTSQERVGTVVSTKMNKTVIVRVEHSTRHPLYKKAIRRTKHYAVHNQSLPLAIGDIVRIVQSKPISRTKHYRVLEKVT